ncbi:MAG: hypothetical protein H6833_07135 [Planctomycetes bacterium]|nr:hypothetical protein [Planctomycetota bacterium]
MQLRIAIVLSCSLSPMYAQADWTTSVPIPQARAVHDMAYDATNQTVVLFGGNVNGGIIGGTWLWTLGGGWVRPSLAVEPSPRRDHAMAYDPLRNEVVLFGGTDASGLVNDTWIWNGTTWRNATPATNNPPARETHMAWDPSSSTIVLFGGYGGANLSDTWSWDGSSWQQLNPPGTQPAGRHDHWLTTDPVSGGVLMFGGWTGAFSDETWLYRNGAWTQQFVTGPTPRSEHAMAYDGRDVVLFGGQDAVGRQRDTWRWNGAQWTSAPTSVSPTIREEHSMVYVDALPAAFLFGGWDAGPGHDSDTWVLSNGQWIELTPDSPPGTGTGAMAHDPTTGTTLLFGGYHDTEITQETWMYRSGWSLVTNTGPLPRAEPAMTFDRVRGEFVLFGGLGNNSALYADTWIFRGGAWQQASPATSPLSRWGHSMTFDESRGTVLMYGGQRGGTILADTWAWDGTNWTQLTPAANPGERMDAALVYDAARGESVFFGGWSNTGFRDETWVFRGGNWNQQTPASAPTARSELSLSYDRVRERVVLFAGQDATGRQNDTWEWDGATWLQRTPLHAPEAREEAAMVFEESTGRVLLFGGWDIGHFVDTWTYGSTPPATAVPYGAGCQGSAAQQPILAARSAPWLGESFDLVVTQMPMTSAATLLMGTGRIALPLDGVGMPGCTLLTVPLVNTAMNGSSGSASLTFLVPVFPGLIGAIVDAQSAVLAAGANPLNVITTQGLEMTTGLK